MSYCRFSSLDYFSDVYLYESLRGHELHVARRRHVFDRGLLPEMPKMNDPDWAEKFTERNRILMDLVSKAEIVPIGLSHDGLSWTLTREEALDKLLMLRREGYRVPQGAIDTLREEIAQAH